jgi:hypothetical protein
VDVSVAAGRGKSGAVAERLCARKGTIGRGKGKELEEEEGKAVLCSLVLFWQRGSVLMTGQGDGGQVLRGKRDGDGCWFGRETEEMGNHGFVGEACPGFCMLKWPRVK